MTGALPVIGSHHPHRLLIRLSLWPKRQQILSAESVLWRFLGLLHRSWSAPRR